MQESCVSRLEERMWVVALRTWLMTSGVWEVSTWWVCVAINMWYSTTITGLACVHVMSSLIYRRKPDAMGYYCWVWAGYCSRLAGSVLYSKKQISFCYYACMSTAINAATNYICGCGLTTWTYCHSLMCRKWWMKVCLQQNKARIRLLAKGIIILA